MILGAKWPHEPYASNVFNFIRKYLFFAKIQTKNYPSLKKFAQFSKNLILQLKFWIFEISDTFTKVFLVKCSMFGITLSRKLFLKTVQTFSVMDSFSSVSSRKINIFWWNKKHSKRIIRAVILHLKSSKNIKYSKSYPRKT